MKPLYSWRSLFACAYVPVVVLLLAIPPRANAEGYEIGGPLAGVKLPLYKTHHGEPAGYPGCLRDENGAFINEPQGQYPERELYPGSVEHWRDYWFKYTPARSLFDRQSLLRNWKAARLPGIPADRVEKYAEPVYWVPRRPGSGTRPCRSCAAALTGPFSGSIWARSTSASTPCA